MMSASFDTIYRDVAQPQREQLLNFRATHPVKHHVARGVQWDYLMGGQGNEWVLLLHPTGSCAESLFPYMLQLEQTYQVLAPTFPQGATTIAECLEGIIALLAAEGIHQVHVFGASLGGFVAQCLVRNSPERVTTLILSHTMLPSKALVCDGQRMVKGVSLIPSLLMAILVRRLLQQRLDRQAVQSASMQRTFWLAYLREMYSSLVTTEDFVAHTKIEVDYHRNYIFTADDVAAWSGRILIIDADADEVVSLSQQEAFMNLYPCAQRYTLHGWGHMGMLAEGNAKVVNDFITQR
jgi:pimeloyl-ACP methyl ester carboxylesterase